MTRSCADRTGVHQVTPARLALRKRFSGDEDRTDGQRGRRHGFVINIGIATVR